ncbi:MAG: hypothetical protein LIP77_05440 [Planctomycetes bacterium]|nr:hypothetical protein [Planctomycetota bacterium]
MTSSSMDKIDARLHSLPPGSLRHQVMTALRHFRASWIELGRLLNEVVYGGDYKEWGYDDFEVYCARELGLKKPTVQKLMISYNYMKKYESKRLHDFEDDREPAAAAEIPEFQTVELLDRVRRREELSEDQVNELHRRAFAGEADEPELRKELRQALRPPPPDEGAMETGAENRRRELAGILRLSRELRRRLVQSGSTIPGGLRERLESCLVELEALD